MKLPVVDLGEFCIRYGKVEVRHAPDTAELIIDIYVGVKRRETGQDDYILCRARCAEDAPRQVFDYQVQNALRGATDVAIQHWLRVDGKQLPDPRACHLASVNSMPPAEDN